MEEDRSRSLGMTEHNASAIRENSQTGFGFGFLARAPEGVFPHGAWNIHGFCTLCHIDVVLILVK